MTTRKIHKHDACELCGNPFVGGKYSHVCDNCRAKSRKGRAKNLMQDKSDSAVGFGRMMGYTVRVQKEKLPVHEICPNFNANDLSCVLCPYDAWKFKNCGAKK